MHLLNKCFITSLLLFAGINRSNIKAQNNITIHDERFGKNEIIGIPEGMITNIDSLLEIWNAKNYLTTDDDCQGGENPYFNKETYIERLGRLPNVIEMPYNEVVREMIDRYCEKMRQTVAFMLGACNFYIPIFEEALETFGLPLELKYLPIVESSLNPEATSKAGAAGLWQFMIGTAQNYGLEVNSLIDERRDPIKSSYAAANYLKDLYNIFGDWSLVLAAYNCGPANVSKAIRRANDKQDYWAIYPYLPVETRGYVPAFIAANYIMNYYCEHNICPMAWKPPISTDTIIVSRDVHFDQIIATCNVKAEEIHALNPQYRTRLIPGSKHDCTLCLPTNSINTFISLADSVYRYKSDELLIRRTEIPVKQTPKNKTSRQTITVKKGETLSTIAKRYGTTTAKLKQLNGLKNTNIRAGQKLVIKK